MGPLRLEELGRVALIAIIAALAATLFFITVELWLPAQGTAPSGLLYFLLFPILAISAPAGIVAGIALHLIVRRLSIPRLVLLPMFLVVSVIVGEVVSGAWYGTIPLSALTGGIAWSFYCFGPFRLWHFKFDASTHIDF